MGILISLYLECLVETDVTIGLVDCSPVRNSVKHIASHL